MADLDAVYRKFGETCEAAQLLETELATVLLAHQCIDEGLLEQPNPERATAIYQQIDRHTLGQLIGKLTAAGHEVGRVGHLLTEALSERNRLAHSFYLRHNFRRNSEAGRELMLNDLEKIHRKLIDAYKAVLLLSGVDLDSLVEDENATQLPTRHLPI